MAKTKSPLLHLLILLFVVLLLFLFVNRSYLISFQLAGEYTTEAKRISYEYGISDAEISFGVFDEDVVSGRTVYSFIVRSVIFSSLSKERKYLYLRDLNELVSASDLDVFVYVYSDGKYRLNDSLESTYIENEDIVFPYGEPTAAPEVKLVFTPPVTVDLISHTELNQILVGSTISFLVEYEKYHWSLPYDERTELRKIYDQGYVYYISDREDALLLEIKDDFAKIKLLVRNKIGWIRKSEVKYYPIP